MPVDLTATANSNCSLPTTPFAATVRTIKIMRPTESAVTKMQEVGGKNVD
jgi:hypothetical protein